MAPSPLNPKTHVRSMSLPSRSHPLTLQVEEQLYRVRSSASASSSPSSSCHNLSCLHDLYDCVENLLKLSLTQQALSNERSSRCVENMLDGSLKLLDVCSTTRDALVQMKECLQTLQSSLRRKRVGELGVANEVGEYMKSRKNANKLLSKGLGDLKRMENKRGFSTLLEDNNLVAIVSVLTEVEATTISVFQSLLSSVSTSRKGSKVSGWSLVSKLMHTRRITCLGEETDINEMEKVDFALSALISKSCKGIEAMYVQDAQKRLKALELSIKGIEDGLDGAFRKLIKTRVSLLNILNH